MNKNKIIATNITYLRKRLGMSQAELGEKMNYSDKAISKWERGESFPDIFVFKELAELFSVNVDYLLVEHNFEKEKIINFADHNHRIITLLSSSLVWFIATLIFAVWGIATSKFDKIWIVFIYAIPLSSVVLLIFNKIWGKRKFTTIITSILIWSILLTIFLTSLLFNITSTWLIFLTGLPFQTLIILWGKLKIFKKKK